MNEILQPDLFGGESRVLSKTISEYQKFKAFNHYRKAESKERCKVCKYSGYVQYANRYYKCSLLGFSSSPATDIRVNNVCDKFETEHKI